MTGTMKVVPFQVSTWAALKAVLPCSTVARYTTRFSATPEKAMLSSSSNTRTIAGAFQLKRLLAAAGASPPDSMEETCCRRWWW